MMSSSLVSESGSCAWDTDGYTIPLDGAPRVGDITLGDVKSLTITPPTLPNFWEEKSPWSGG